ncbi:hypothetical protein JNB63_16030 [Microbacterium trichothecenolyticum]|uniref:hypothetical protein n=1 Tax=Microbacterium trichothecenolyticum TaxID=69370 RepID=UPI001C6E9E6D|nr:hypothetical protein [Microbacterium trichothecenolyticum]MBW9121608.1 hypothetical protein [Microbacterium trichothecenolyticum]
MTLVDPTAAAASLQLAQAARELARLIDRIMDAAVVARGLADAVHWQAKAATAFHDRATLWAGDVSGLACLAEAARYDVAQAQDRAAFAESFPGLFPGARR